MTETTCTYGNDGGSPPTIVSSSCTTTGTSTISIPAPLSVFDPFLETTAGIGLWIALTLVIVAAIQKFR